MMISLGKETPLKAKTASGRLSIYFQDPLENFSVDVIASFSESQPPVTM